MQKMEVKDNHIIDIFRKRDGQQTTVKLGNGSRYEVWDIAWGYDMGDEYAHITTNVSPGAENRTVDFFFTNEISEIVDSSSGGILFKR